MDEDNALLVRLFYIHDDKAFNEGLVNLAFWTMQSHILNSDYTDFLPRIVFHIEAALCNATKRLCDNAVVPADSIMTFDETLFSFDRLPPSPSYKALAPFLDPALERFRRVVIVDLDTLSLWEGPGPKLPLMDISLNRMPGSEIADLQSWTTRLQDAITYSAWWGNCGFTGDEWVAKIADVCGYPVEQVRSVLYPSAPETTPWPFTSGAHFNILTALLIADFRSFMKSATVELALKEVAYTAWMVRNFLDNDERVPTKPFDSYQDEHPNWPLMYNADTAWELRENERTPSFGHLHGFPGLDTYAYDLLRAIGWTTTQAAAFRDTITADFAKLRSDKQSSV